MGSKLLRAACLIAIASVFPGAGRRDSPKEEMRFGAEAAQRGLWREAAFRWEKVLKNDPDNPRLRNNLAVAYESLGQFDLARQEYEAARRLDPDSKEIRGNLESFRELCKTLKSCSGEEAAAPGASPAPAPPPGPGDAGPGDTDPDTVKPDGAEPGGAPPGGV